MVHMVFMFIKILLIFYKVTKLVLGVFGFIRFSPFLYLLSGWQIYVFIELPLPIPICHGRVLFAFVRKWIGARRR